MRFSDMRELQTAAKMAGLEREFLELRMDAIFGRFARLHMVELGGGWQINQTFIPGAPSLEDVTDALNSDVIDAMLTP